MIALLGWAAAAWATASVIAAAALARMLRTTPVQPYPPVLTAPVTHPLDDDHLWMQHLPVDCLRDGDPEIDRRIAEMEAQFTGAGQ